MSKSGERLPYFNLYTGDFRKIGERMSPAARGHFIWLLICQWDNGPLPSDIKALRRLSPGLSATVWKEIEPHFELITTGLVHLPLEAMRAKAEERENTASKKARDAANARWGRHRPGLDGDASGIAASMLGAVHEQCSGDANQMSESEPEPPPTHSGGIGGGCVGGGAPKGQTAPTPAGRLHSSCERARLTLVAQRGHTEGEAMFQRCLSSRVDSACKKFITLGVKRDMVATLVTVVMEQFAWDEWSDRMSRLVTEARTKNNPGGWLVSTLLGERTAPPLRMSG